jgi:hypothetical protein
MTHTDPPNIAPTTSFPAPPRRITARARRRSWNESNVRLWMILAVVVGVITAYFTVQQLREALSERRLIREGRAVEARVEQFGQRGTMANIRRGEAFAVTVTYPGANGEPRQSEGLFIAEQDRRLSVGDTIEIRVDPNDPDRWTTRSEPRPWAEHLTAAIILVPLLALTLLMTLTRRAQVLRTWRDEPAMPATVVETKQSAIAPMSRVIRFVLHEGDDRRVWTTLHPARQAPHKGDTITVICPPANPTRAIVARLYGEET